MFDSTTSVDSPVQTPPSAVTEACGCGAQLSLPDSGRVAERLSAFRREHRCLPVGEPVSDDEASENTSQQPVPPVSPPVEDPQPVAVAGTILSSGKAIGFS